MKNNLAQTGSFDMFLLFYGLERVKKEIRGAVFSEPVCEVDVDD
jgi:hypothetical protein